MRSSPLKPGFGLAVEDIDLSQPMSLAAKSEIEQALNEHRLLLFRGQHLQKRHFVAFGRLFGELQNHVRSQWLADDFPEVLLVTNSETVGSGKPVYSEEGARAWHSDGSIIRRSGVATALYGVEVTSQGGDTQIADTASAYDALPASMKARLEDMVAVHDVAHGTQRVAHLLSPEELRSRQLSDEQRKKNPPVEQPVVRIHPVTGRKALYVGVAHTSHIVGLPPAESRALLDELIAHSTQPEYIYSHRWQPGDVLIWDNRMTLHRGTPYAPGQRRMLWRVTSIGEPAL